MKKHFILGCITLAFLCLNGCNLNSQTPVQTFTASSISIDKVSNGVYELIHKIRTADEGVISLKNVSREITVLKLERELVTKLKANGYAVQEILPAEARQNGDLDEMKIKGTLLTVNLQPLAETNFLQLSVDLGDESYYRMITLQKNTLTPVSQWARKRLYEPYLE